MSPEKETNTMEKPISYSPAAVPAPAKPKKPMARKLYTTLMIPACVLAGVTGSFVYNELSSNQNSQTATYSSTVISQEGDAIAAAASKVGPSVVSIVTESTTRTLYGPSVQQGAGTGVIISKDGYVVTNKHVVSASGKVQIILSDGTSYTDVKFVGSDPTNDISFLKIGGVSDLTPVALGDSSNVKVGQKVVAIGNALGEYQNTVTTGIVSALGRPVTAADASGNSYEQLENLLQTDAAINPGNSGGPLVNLGGEIIGINTAVATEAQGIGFAIPINDVKGMVKTLLATGEVVKPYIGVRYVSITPDIAKEYNLKVKSGAYVVGDGGQPPVASGSPAERAGLKDKDIIIKVNDTNIDSTHPFASVIAQYSPGDNVKLTLLRDDKETAINVTVAKR